MKVRLPAYEILSYTTFFIGALLAYVVWQYFPPSSNAWSSTLWFIIFYILGEMLVVSVHDDEVDIFPTFPIIWAATCVLGPVVTIVSVTIGHLVASGIMFISFKLINRISRSYVSDNTNDSKTIARYKIKDFFANIFAQVGSKWVPVPTPVFIHQTCAGVGAMAIGISLSAMVYSALGGKFLIDTNNNINIILNFIMPMLGLAITSLILDHAIHAICMAVLYPVPGAKGLYDFLLRLKIVIIEDSLPIWRADLFFIVAAICLAYLYDKIGAWGFLLAAMPVLALRDFYRQWAEERSMYENTITTLATYMQHYHPYTRGHLKRVADLSERLAREMKLPAESVRLMNIAAFLHDIGKIGVNDEILDKTDKLTDEEWEMIKQHPVKGAEIVMHLEFLDSIVNWIKYHHKWYNGSGYPAGDEDGVEPPIEAAVISVVDAFDAMTDDRELSMQWICDSCGYVPPEGERPRKCPKCGMEKRRTYREPLTVDQAIEELRRGAGSQFHPRVVKAFLNMIKREGVHGNG